MIVIPRDPRMSPDIKATKIVTADALTGDGVFADTDLVRIPYDGFLMVNAVASADTNGGLLYVPQIHHQENRYCSVPVLGAGIAPDIVNMVNYKIPVHKGDTPRILWDEADNITCCFTGYFYRGMNLRKVNNPVAFNTPDVTVALNVAGANYTNVLEGTDLEDFPLPGMLLVWASCATQDAEIQVQQKGHQTGNHSDIPEWANGLACQCGYDAPFKMYVPATGQPVVTITNPSTSECFIVASMYVDWASVSPRLRARMGY